MITAMHDKIENSCSNIKKKPHCMDDNLSLHHIPWLKYWSAFSHASLDFSSFQPSRSYTNLPQNHHNNITTIQATPLLPTSRFEEEITQWFSDTDSSNFNGLHSILIMTGAHSPKCKWALHSCTVIDGEMNSSLDLDGADITQMAPLIIDRFLDNADHLQANSCILCV